jgi:hypothetical protein
MGAACVHAAQTSVESDRFHSSLAQTLSVDWVEAHARVTDCHKVTWQGLGVLRVLDAAKSSYDDVSLCEG